MKKKIRDLTWADVGKTVILEEENGDRASGILNSWVVSKHGVGQVRIGNQTFTLLGPDLEIKIVD